MPGVINFFFHGNLVLLGFEIYPHRSCKQGFGGDIGAAPLVRVPAIRKSSSGPLCMLADLPGSICQSVLSRWSAHVK